MAAKLHGPDHLVATSSPAVDRACAFGMLAALLYASYSRQWVMRAHDAEFKFLAVERTF